MLNGIEAGRGERVTVVLEPALRSAIADEAHRRSLSTFIRDLIADAVERHARSGSVASV
jgi:hypothetical protein